MKNKRLVSLLLICLLSLTLSVRVQAEEGEGNVLHIASLEDFLRFAESCRLDSYSENLTVSLDTNLDLRGTDFDGIPYFGGVFDGNGYVISGLAIDAEGSVQGLFRYLGEGAVLQNLHVMGTVAPGGSRSTVGGLVGENAGHILRCSFQGSVTGADSTGGLVGRNGVTGILEDCRMKGAVTGGHFVGGIAGENAGVIRRSINSADVNITAQQNSIDIADVTLETLTGSEAANTVTDVGGVAGKSNGVIRESENYGAIGYPHMGYNIGGIAGTQSGYLVDCRNYGEIRGRKEVGGIVGQMEPASLLEYTEDVLQILEQQLGGMSYLVNRATINVRNNSQPLSDQLGILQGQAGSALEALAPLLGGGGIPDPDSITAAQNVLSTSLQAMGGTVSQMGATLETTVSGLTQDLQAVAGQISAMGATLGDAAEELGGSITDVSDEDSAENLSGKVERCRNYADVSADLNAGGITGAMAIENDLDLLQDFEIAGEDSLDFENKLRAVLLQSENHGSVRVGKQHAGGIVGWQTLGLVKGCVNVGALDSAGADYVGGISGYSAGYIRNCAARCDLEGGRFVGGIAGSAARLSDSLAQVNILAGSEKLGALLGGQETLMSVSDEEETEEPIHDNYYLPIGKDIGAIDAISYQGKAQPLSRERFIALEALPEQFRSVTLSFVPESGEATTVVLTTGSKLTPEDIPAFPEKAGYEGCWEGLNAALGSEVFFDQRFEAVYTAHRTTLESENQQDSLALVLLQGDFREDAALQLSRCKETPALGEREKLLDARCITLIGEGAAESLRFLLPEEADSQRLRPAVLRNGQWTERPCRIDKSYAVIDWSEGDEAVALIQRPREESPVPVFAAAGAVLLAVIALIRRKKGKKEVSP